MTKGYETDNKCPIMCAGEEIIETNHKIEHVGLEEAAKDTARA